MAVFPRTPPSSPHPPQPASRWLLAGIMILVLALGWRYPLAGLAVPVVMGIGLAAGVWRGRYACGNLCPRGGFYDTFFVPLGGKRPIPEWLRDMRLRWALVVVLMGVMAWRGAQNPASLSHWGGVFWLMCAVTTAVGLVLGLRYSPRAWCSACPVGTMAQAAGRGGEKRPLQLAADCRHCHLCDHACPMQLSPHGAADAAGRVVQRDCVQCGACIGVCPRGALAWEPG